MVVTDVFSGIKIIMTGCFQPSDMSIVLKERQGQSLSHNSWDTLLNSKISMMSPELDLFVCQELRGLYEQKTINSYLGVREWKEFIFAITKRKLGISKRPLKCQIGNT